MRLAWLKKHGISFALNLAVVLLLLLKTSNVPPPTFIDRLENFSYDLRLNLLMSRTIDERIVIFDIDEKRLKEQGLWPWARDKMATLVNQLFGQYVPQELVDEMAQSPKAISLKGESREMMVLFSDIRVFTTMSEGLDPE